MIVSRHSSGFSRDTSKQAARWTMALAAIAVVYLAARLWSLSGICLDGDEVFSLLLARESWPALFSDALHDAVHPPFFYVLLKLWRTVAGEGLFALRLLPVLISLAGFPALLALCRGYKLSRAETAAVLLSVALDPFLVFYSQHLRMYSLLFTVALWSMWATERLARSRRPVLQSAVLLALANALLLYAQYFGALLIACELLYILLRRRERLWPFLASSVAAAVAFAPWLLLAAHAAEVKGGLASNLNWIPRPGWREFVWFYTDATGSAALWAWGVVPPILVAAAFAAWAVRSPHRLRPFWLPLLVATAPVLLLFAVSRLAPQSVWGHRHILFSAAALILIGCVAGSRSQPKSLRRVLVVLWFAWLAFASVVDIRGDKQKLRYDALVLHVLDQPAPGSLTVYAVDPHLHYPLQFYVDELNAGRTENFAIQPRVTPPVDVRVIEQESLPAHPVTGSWLAVPVPSPADRSLPGYLREQGCTGTDEMVESSRYGAVKLVRLSCVGQGR